MTNVGYPGDEMIFSQHAWDTQRLQLEKVPRIPIVKQSHCWLSLPLTLLGAISG